MAQIPRIQTFPKIQTFSGLQIWMRVFIPFSLGYFISYLLRVINIVITDDLVREVDLSAADLGLLTSAYFLSFAACQLPLGVCLDRFGPRRCEAILLIFAGAGALIFSIGTSIGTLLIGRLLIGVGVSACLMAAFKAYTMWFKAEDRSWINGCHLAVGGLGAFVGTYPVHLLNQLMGWRSVFLLLSCVVFMIAAMIWWLVPKGEEAGSSENMREQIYDAVRLMGHPLFMRITPLIVAVQGTYLGVQSLWIGPWLRDVADFSTDQVASTVSYVTLAIIAGFIFWGAIADKLKAFGATPMWVTLISSSLFLVMNILLLFPQYFNPIMLWLGYAFIAVGNTNVYSALTLRFPLHLSGRVITAINFLTFVYAFFVQWFFGVILDQWPIVRLGHYQQEGYHVGLLSLTIIIGLSFLWMLFAYRKTSLHHT